MPPDAEYRCEHIPDIQRKLPSLLLTIHGPRLPFILLDRYVRTSIEANSMTFLYMHFKILFMKPKLGYFQIYDWQNTWILWPLREFKPSTNY